MKIGFLYDAVYPWIKGGGEKTLYELACELRDRGHQCHFFGMHLWDGPADVEREGLHYHGICESSPLYGPDGKRRLSQTLAYTCGLLQRLPRYAPQTFDLFDVHAFPFVHYPAFQFVHATRARKVPWLLTWLEVWGGNYWRRYLGSKGFIGAAVERWCGRTAPHHLCISPTTGRRLQTLIDVPAAKISVIPRGFAPPEQKFSASKLPRRCVVAGRLLAYKQVDVVLRAWPDVVRQLPDATLEIVGDGPERRTLEQIARKLGVERSVLFRGQLSEREHVLEAIAAAELLLQPSAREGQSTVVLEALSLGTPVLAAVGDETAVGDFLGPADSTSAARLDVAAQPQAWAERIVQLLNDEPLRRHLADEGRRVAVELNWKEHVAPQVEALYRRIIEEQRGV